MKLALLVVDIRAEQDVVAVRKRARQVAALLGCDSQDQIRLATATSEIARNTYQYAGQGKVHFRIESGVQSELVLEFVDSGPGIGDVAAILEGRYRSQTGMGVGLAGARKLVDGFRIESELGRGTRVELQKTLPGPAPSPVQVAKLVEQLVKTRPESALEEERAQNHELMRALDELKKSQGELILLNQELEETNRGVLALYAELEEKAEALRRSNEVKSRFFSEMNHEVRTPINAILGLAEILLNGTTGEPLPEQEKALNFIRKSAHQLSELVNDLLDLAKTEAGKMVVRSDTFSVSELFAGLRGMFRPIHSKEQVALSFDDVEGLPALQTDEGKVSQVLRNFISNALKFTDRGTVQVSAEVVGDTIVFSVRDTGIGIAPEQLANLFEPFTQIETPHQRRVRGTGLGLSVSRGLAELLGGTVRVESTLGEGSTFQLVVPRRYREQSARPSVPSPAAGTDSIEKILIIDDDEVARYLLRGLLLHKPLEVIEAATGDHGFERAREEQPDVIFLDLSMPGRDGYQVLGLLKADPETQHIPVVVHTATALTDAQRALLSRQASAILSKQSSASDGAEHVEAALRKAAFDRANPRG